MARSGIVRRLRTPLAAVVAVCCVLAGISAPASGAPRDGVEAVSAGGPRVRSFDRYWKFALVNSADTTDPTGAYANAGEPGYDDSGWRNVTLPHDWSIEHDPSTNGGTTSSTGFLPGGLGWYRKTFTLPSELENKRISIEFDGVYMDSVVYVNGHRAAAHPYGYTGFAVDLSEYAHTGGRTPNVVAVKVRNKVPSSRWYSGSGIYRDVHLVVTEPVHVARHGVYVTTPDLATTYPRGYATVRARATVADDADGTTPAQVTWRVRDPRGRVVATRTVNATAGGDPATADLRVTHPDLWSTTRPALYTLDTEVRAGGRRVDATRTPFGVRWFRLDPDTGFSLNGEPMKLRGVDLHHDQGALGAAATRDSLTRQMSIMKSMGVNALRTAHNPPSPELVDVCQRLGIVMMVEAFDTWRTPKVPYDYGRFFDANSDADITEMFNASRNSPAVIMWSIGNEIPDSTSPAGVPMARRLIADVKAADDTRPIVIGSDKYRSLPERGSPEDRILRMLDGLGLNYNTAGSVDALHARYPDTFLFESESSSSTSTRGVYQDPEQLNTGENHTPGRRGASSYDNNMASWTMPGEYGLKKDRDRRFFAGEFLWSGFDYIGEPTPYDVFPVKSSFFGAVDTAGFPKDLYHLFQSQWSGRPMVHLLPANWTNHRRGEKVRVWAYSNADTVELTLNGRSLGTRRFDHKTTTYGHRYLETTEATGDDKNVTGGPYPGSYTSPNGSAGKLHLTWDVPFEPGRLVATAKRNGKVVATDEVDTAGEPAAIRLTPDRRTVASGGRGLAYVTAQVVDAHGVTVPYADNALRFRVDGGSPAGADNGREESAENYRSSTRTAFNGKALAIVRSPAAPGPIRVTATAPGLRGASLTLAAAAYPPAQRPVYIAPSRPAGPGYRPPEPTPEMPARATGAEPVADAGYSGAPDTLPAEMLDGTTASGGWSSHYVKAATALLPAVSRAHAREWVSLSWPSARTVRTLRPYFTTGDGSARPAAVTVSYWNGSRFVPVRHQRVTWATESGAPTAITFDPVRTGLVRLDMTSAAPGTDRGFLTISELKAG